MHSQQQLPTIYTRIKPAFSPTSRATLSLSYQNTCALHAPYRPRLTGEGARAGDGVAGKNRVVDGHKHTGVILGVSTGELDGRRASGAATGDGDLSAPVVELGTVGGTSTVERNDLRANEVVTASTN